MRGWVHRSVLRVALVTGLVTSALGCVRSVPELPTTPNGVSISGRVVERDTTSGQLVGVARVRMTTADGPPVHSDAEGRFELTGLPLGTRRLVFTRTRPGSGPTDPEPSKVLSGLSGVADGERLALGDVELRAPGTLVGDVRLAGISDPAYAEGTLVAVAESAFRAIVSRDGTYVLARLPEGGTYDIVAFRAGYTPARLEGVSVLAHKTDRLESLMLEPSSGASSLVHVGSARRAGADEHGGISVTCTTDSSTTTTDVVRATTDTSGRYSLTLPYGMYRCVFASAGYLNWVATGVAALPEGALGLGPVTLTTLSDAALPADDADGDSCPDAVDAAPSEPDACLDSDGDGLADAASPDDDGDGLSDAEEASPGRDGVITDSARADTDGDGVPDGVDVCPALANPAQRAEDCQTGGALVLTGLTPARVGVGMPVTLRGRGFALRADSHVVTFGGEVLATALAVTRDRLTVIVPVGARDGVVSVTDGKTVATSTTPLAIAPPPAIADFSPRRAPVGATVRVRGQGLTGGRVLVGGLEAPVTSVSDEALSFLVPPTLLGPQPVVVRADGGRVAPTAPLVVLGPARISSLDPAVVGPGQLLRVRGGGLSVGPGERAELAFVGSSSRAVATRVRDDELQVIIPDDATSGVVTLHHPAGVVTSPGVLEVSSSLMVVRDLQPTIALEGDRVRLRGNNLERATEVRVAGRPVAIAQQSPSALEIVVPVGTPAGHVTVHAATGTATAPVGLSMIRRGAVWPLAVQSVNGQAFDPLRNVLYVATSSGTLELDLDSGARQVLLQQSGVLHVSPSGRWLVVLDGSVDGDAERVTLTALDLASLQQTACTWNDPGVSTEFLFTYFMSPVFSADESTAAIVSRRRMVRLPLGQLTGECLREGSFFEPALLGTEDDPNTAIVGIGFGFARVDLSRPSSGLLDRWPTAQSRSHANFMWPPVATDTLSGIIPGSRLWYVRDFRFLERVDPTADVAADLTLQIAGYPYSQTSLRRFAVAGSTSLLDVVDLALGERSTTTSGAAIELVTGDSARSRFAVLSGSDFNFSVTIYDIDAAPID
jgi:hypothetical protein